MLKDTKSMSYTAEIGDFSATINVVIGAVLGFAATYITQYVTERRAAAREQRMMRHQRLESLVKAMYEDANWLQEEKNNLVFRNYSHDKPRSLDNIKMLHVLYFPELNNEMYNVIKNSEEILKFINNEKISKLKDEDLWMKTWDDKALKRLYQQYQTAFAEFTTKCGAIIESIGLKR
jgi:hypothetical protein